MKTRILFFIAFFAIINLQAQNEYWKMSYEATSIFPVVPFGKIEQNESTVTAYSTGTLVEISPFGKALREVKFAGVADIRNIFYVHENENFTVVGVFFHPIGEIKFRVYGANESDFLYEIDLDIEVGLVGYPVAVNTVDGEYYVFADDVIVRFDVAPIAFTELNRITNSGLANAVVTFDNVTYVCNDAGDIYSIENDILSGAFYSHNGPLFDIIASDAGLVVVGSSADQNTLTKIDFLGNVIFSNTYDQENGQAVSETMDSGYIFTGKGASTEGYISKVDENGNLIWTFDEMKTLGVELIEGKNENIFVMGLAQDQPKVVELIKLSPDGDTGPSIDLETSFPLAVNNIEASVSSGGTIFLDDDQNAAYFYPRGEETATIFASGLWLGGLDPGGNLKVAAQEYLTDQDFQMGPIDSDPTFFNRIWSVKKGFIQDFRNDIADGTKDQDWLLDILEWPAKGNTIYNIEDDALTIDTDLAPFEDVNDDGIYNPFDGDYPKIKGDQMLWWVFNDDKVHTNTFADRLKVEVEASLFAFSCDANELINNSTFLDFKIENKSAENYPEFKMAYWMDADLGCFDDDYIGAIPDANAIYVYNMDDQDGDANGNCAQGIPTFDDMIPVQSVMLINNPLDNFVYYNNNSVGGPWPQGTTDPQTPTEYYNYMSGLWRDGTPLTPGGTGYSPYGVPTQYAFPDNPSEPGGWSCCEENLGTSDRRIIMSTDEEQFLPGTVRQFQLAFTTFPDVNHPCPDVTFIKDALLDLQSAIDLGALDFNLDLGPDIPNPPGTVTLDAGAGAAAYLWSNESTDQSIIIDQPGVYSVTATTHFGCEVTDEIVIGMGVATQNIVENDFIKVHPNPADDYLNIEFIANDYPSEFTLEIYDINGRLRDYSEEKNNSTSALNKTIDTSDWPTGMYLLIFKAADQIFVERVMVR